MDGYEWVPFHEELARKLVPYRNKQSQLVRVLREAGVLGLTDQNPAYNHIELTEVDPFTFFSLITKYKRETRTEIYGFLKTTFDISADVPLQFLGVPNVDARQAWLFPYKFHRNDNDVDKLWSLFEDVVTEQKLTDETFYAAKSVKYAGLAKLTQAIFRVSPSKYFPIDGQTQPYLERLKILNKFNNIAEYYSICEALKTRINLPFYIHSYLAWQQNQTVFGEAEYQQEANELASNSSANYMEKPGGEAVGQSFKIATKVSYTRNPEVAAKAIEKANFQCELDQSHQTFSSQSKNKPYVEAHHLIPLSVQGDFHFSLDVLSNVVALCPLCHKLLHHGKFEDKKHLLKLLLTVRQDALVRKEIGIDLKNLYRYYSGELLEEDA